MDPRRFPVPAMACCAVSRLPAITVWFWLIKSVITAADVFWPDYLYRHLGQTLTSGLMAWLWSSCCDQFRVRRYQAWAFWPATSRSASPHRLANGIYDLAHLGYAWITVLYLVVLVALLAWSRAREGTLSLRRIDTARRKASTGPSRWSRSRSAQRSATR